MTRKRPPTVRWECTRCRCGVEMYVTARTVPTCTCGRGLKPLPMVRTNTEEEA